ncbi:MAG: GDP-L-fucose synthase [Candidatus Delongbacteria bacterium]|nr:GDP-L-fucose synthase [Candidatus Delongbacteria bacterium]MBN2836860.1 GDP-L-fucose synthase [Candidatus Delongbacteria bacterium]
MNKDSKIFVAGNTGLVGSAIVRRLKKDGYSNLVFAPYPEYDLRNQIQVNTFFEFHKPEYVFLAAAKVGGILANNSYPADFMYDNLMIEANVIHSAYTNKVKKLLFLGSSCIYPKNCPQPIKEEYLLSGSLEPTNEAYALAKISGLKMCDYYRKQYGCDFISAMPTNLYGPNDNFHLESSHVLPAMLRKMHLAKLLYENRIDEIKIDLNAKPFSYDYNTVSNLSYDQLVNLLSKYGVELEGNRVSLKLWGSGSPFREFLYVDDLADALLFLMNNYSDFGHVNVGCGIDLTIKDLANLVKEIVGFSGDLDWDTSKPDGTPKKLLDVSKLFKAGWKPVTELKEGMKKVYDSYLNN